MGTHPGHRDTFVHAGRMLHELWARGWEERRWKLGAGDFQGAPGSELHHAEHRDGVSRDLLPLLAWITPGTGDLRHLRLPDSLVIKSQMLKGIKRHEKSVAKEAGGGGGKQIKPPPSPQRRSSFCIISHLGKITFWELRASSEKP